MLVDQDVINQILSSPPASNVAIMAVPGKIPAVVVQTPDGGKVILTPSMARKLMPQMEKMADMAEIMSNDNK
jgi:hypothetical protein